MHGAVRASDRQRRFHPRPLADTRRHVAVPHHGEQRDHRGLAFAEYDGTPPYDRELRGFCRVFESRSLGFRKDAREQPAGGEMRGRNARVIPDVPPYLESTRDLLRVVTFNTAARWEVGWTSEHQIELLVGAEDVVGSEVAHPDVVAVVQPVLLRSLSGQPGALLL